jgi:mono/diheme cytochrome c family protein
MSLSRCRNLSYVVLLLAAACGDGDPSHQNLGAPAEVVEPGEDEIVQDDDQKVVAVEPDAIGLSCDVKAFLATHCQGCHGAEAKNGTPLLTHNNLVAASKKDPTALVADRMIMRMIDSEKPMPPVAKNDRIASTDLAMFLAWVDLDMPKGRCDQ